MKTFLLLLLFPALAWGQEVARVFGVPVTAEEVRLTDEKSVPQAARMLKDRVLRDALPRFVAAHNLKPTAEEVAQYQSWEAEFRRRNPPPPNANRPEIDPAVSARVHAQWIEIYKIRKALHDKFGGRVGITKFGPDPAGATEALLREHEKKGELQIVHPALAREFWDQLAREPRMPASKPEHSDFTYYWLKPPAAAK